MQTKEKREEEVKGLKSATAAVKRLHSAGTASADFPSARHVCMKTNGE